MTDVVLQQRDCDVLQALCEDLAECGPGIPRKDLEHIAATRWLDRVLRRLREAGHRIGVAGTDERYQLLDPETSAGAPDERRPATPMGSGPAPAGANRQASGAPVEGTLFTLPSTPHYRSEAA